MVPPRQQADQESQVERLRYDADMAIAHALRSRIHDAHSRAEAVELLDRISGTLHNDIAIYRRRILAEIGGERDWGRRLHLVPTPASATAETLGLRVPNGHGS